jgi:hypothetical protein
VENLVRGMEDLKIDLLKPSKMPPEGVNGLGGMAYCICFKLPQSDAGVSIA